MTDTEEMLCWNDMSEEDKADFFSSEPFKKQDMTDIEKIKAEIERLRKQDGNPYYPNETADQYYARGVHLTCDNLLNFINSLPEEPVSEDLEEASNNYAELLPRGRISKKYCKIDFKAGAQWQKNKLIKWLTIESDYLIGELKKGNKDYGLPEQYRAQLYKEVVNKIKDE